MLLDESLSLVVDSGQGGQDPRSEQDQNQKAGSGVRYGLGVLAELLAKGGLWADVAELVGLGRVLEASGEEPDGPAIGLHEQVAAVWMSFDEQQSQAEPTVAGDLTSTARARGDVSLCPGSGNIQLLGQSIGKPLADSSTIIFSVWPDHDFFCSC